ncbi:MAG: hypothetical protein ACOZBL_05525 [Patescibacteria group bacterium]
MKKLKSLGSTSPPPSRKKWFIMPLLLISMIVIAGTAFAAEKKITAAPAMAATDTFGMSAVQPASASLQEGGAGGTKVLASTVCPSYEDFKLIAATDTGQRSPNISAAAVNDFKKLYASIDTMSIVAKAPNNIAAANGKIYVLGYIDTGPPSTFGLQIASTS